MKKKHLRALPGLAASEPEVVVAERPKPRSWKKPRRHARGTRQYLVFTGPWGAAIHPVVRSSSGTFLGIRFQKLVSVGGPSGQSAEHRRAVGR